MDWNMEKEVKVKEVKSAKAENTAANDSPAKSEKPGVDALMAQLSELNDKYLRVAAELENTRRRAALDADIAARGRAMSIAGNFLPVMDAVDAALSHNPNDPGLFSMAQAVRSAFSKIGIVKIESVGQSLNPQFHNAIQVVEPAKLDEPCAVRPVPNTVVGELQAGYMFGDSVLRPAMVVVSK
jgi:molecular chaperone GrpE